MEQRRHILQFAIFSTIVGQQTKANMAFHPVGGTSALFQDGTQPMSLSFNCITTNCIAFCSRDRATRAGLDTTDGSPAPDSRSSFGGNGVVHIEDEIIARIRASRLWGGDVQLTDFQIMPAENGCILINLRTRRAYLIYDEFSELHDLEQLFPKVSFMAIRPKSRKST